MNDPHVKQALKDWMMMARIDTTNITFCDVKPLRDNLKGGLDRVEFKGCFNNATRYVFDYNGVYCLGYAASVIPVEHAWVRFNDEYFDPTWEKYSEIGSGYASVVQLDRHTLLQAIEMNDNTPPSIFDLFRLGFISPSTVDPLERLRDVKGVI